jgi:ABC-type transport system involved in cytochrome c biogenesis permease subunit
MSILILDNFLVNVSFVTLLLTTFLYWLPLTWINVSPIFGNIGMLFANIQLLAFLIVRWIDSHHFPLSNLYESLIFLSWSLTLGHWVIQSMMQSQWVGAITAPSALCIQAFASFTLPDSLKHAMPLVPALQSNWLLMHVTMMILSYSMLILGSLFSLAFLVLYQPIETNLLRFLDNLSYRTLGFGFPVLTMGIVSGAVWANQAWGSYWSWDPKETWALITWVVFAIYFHFRLNHQWSGQKPAILASVGFVLLWICYLGVNLLGKGLHSYGWF